MKDKVFKPVDFSHRGTAYVKHHHKMLGGNKRFTTNTSCPKCGGYQRQHLKGKEDMYSSFCVRCHTDNNRSKKYKQDRASTLTVEQRRAIEDHQHRTNDLGDYLL